MNFLENDLEEIIYKANKDFLADRGLYLKRGKLFRQLRIGNYGILDLLEFDRPRYSKQMKMVIPGVCHVLELKKDKIGMSAFLQAVGYARGIQRYLYKKIIEIYWIT